jgi:hypothetical protein
VDCLTVLYYRANSVGVYLWFVSSRKQLLAPLAICSQIQLVCNLVCHGAVHFRATYISARHPC